MDYRDLSRWLDSLFPEVVEQSLQQRLALRIRARVLLGLFLSNVCILLALLLTFVCLTLFTANSFVLGAALVTVVLLFMVFQGWLFYYLGNIELSSIMFSMSFYAITLIFVVSTGGWTSPTKVLFFCAPMISFLVGGRQEGLYMSALVAFSGLILLLAQQMQFSLFQFMPEENRVFIEIISWLVSLVLLSSGLLVYERVMEDLNRKVERLR